MKQSLLKKLAFLIIILTTVGITAKAQSAINLQGVSGNQALAAYNFDLVNGFTVEYEMYIDNIVNYNGGITSTIGNIAQPLDVYIDNTGSMGIFVGDGNSFQSTSINSFFTSGQWYNIAITVDPNNSATIVYVNGKRMASTGTAYLANSGNLFIGNRGDNATFANSAFSNVLVWSGARTQAQIQADQYTCFSGSETGLQVFYNMSEGTGTTLDNLGSAGAAANATITGGYNWTGGPTTRTETVTATNHYNSPSGNFVWTKSGNYTDIVPATGTCAALTVNVNLTLTHLMYVDQFAAAGHDGLSWLTAYNDFATAVDSSKAGDTIFVATGNYQPDFGGSYTMKDSVKIYGGFAGYETALSQRNIQGNITTLTGNNAVVINNSTNNLTNAALLDGFTITGGGTINSTGGGMYDSASSPTLNNLIFTGNQAYEGGGIYNTSGSAVITNVQFTNNIAQQRGGAIYNFAGNSNLVITNVVFAYDSAQFGGAMRNYGSATFTNTVFYSDNALRGGAIYNTNTIKLINTTFADDTASDAGGGVYNSAASCIIENSVLWGNSAQTSAGDIDFTGGGSLTATYNYTQTSIAGTGNIMGTIDPFKADGNTSVAQGTDGVWATKDDGLELANGSTAIGAGSNAAVPVNLTNDITGVARIQGTNVDMGAYANGTNTISFMDTTVCTAFSYTSISNIIYTVTSSGTVIDTIQNAILTDSLIHINVTVHHNTFGDTTAVACDRFTWYGSTYYNNGTPQFNLTNKVGCDSIVTLHLTINNSIYTDTTVIACNQYKWYGNTYTESNNYYYYGYTSKVTHCDSVIQLNLTINYASASAITVGTYASSYMFKGTNETASGHYTFDTTNAVGCDSTINLYLTLYKAPVITANTTCAPSILTLSGTPTPTYIQWQQNGGNTSSDTIKWDAGTVVAQDRLSNTSSDLSLAVDTAGNVFVGSGTEVIEYPKGSTAGSPGIMVANNGIGNAQDIKVDLSGNLFVLDNYNREVLEFPVGSDSTTAPLVVAQTYSQGIKMLVDNADNIYVSNPNYSDVVYYSAGNPSNSTPIAGNGLNTPTGLALDNAGNLYVSDNNYNEVFEFPKGSNTSTSASFTVGAELNSSVQIGSVAVDGNGDVFAQAEFPGIGGPGGTPPSSIIYIYAPGSTLISHPIDSIMLSGSPLSSSFVIDASGNVYATDALGRNVTKYTNIIKDTINVNQAGTYAVSVNSFSGSQTVSNAIKIGIANTGDTTATACGNYKWFGTNYTASGVPTHTLTNKSGCDSVITLQLTILQPTTGDTTATACGSFKWYGTMYNVSGTPTYTTMNKVGCDSVVTLHLTVNNADTSIAQSGAVFTANATSATYQWLTCGTPDVAISGATSAAYTATSNGNYAVVVAQNGCIDTSDCRTILFTGMKNVSTGDNIDVYPMPNNGQFTISFNGNTYQTVTIYDETGKQITKQTINGNADHVQLDLSNYADGLYYARLVSANGVVNKKVIIQK